MPPGAPPGAYWMAAPPSPKRGIPAWGWVLISLGVLFIGGIAVVGGFIWWIDTVSDNDSRAVQEAVPMGAGVGTCVTSGGSVVACEGAHRFEVFADYESIGGARPSAGFAGYDEHCADAFPSYVGIDYLGSRFDYQPRHPSAAEWASGYRTTLCVLFDITTDGSIVGSARGSGR